MTQRILNTVRSLAVLGAVSLGFRRSGAVASEPEPVRSGIRPDDEGDAWLFERPQTNLGSGAYMLEQEYARASGALSSLRNVLSNMSRLPAMAEAAYEAPYDAPLATDPMLFDEERAAIPVATNLVPFDDDDLFIEQTFSAPRLPAQPESLQRVA